MKKNLHISLEETWHLDPKKQTTYRVNFYTQPRWDYLKSRIYHWYDMRVFKIPGFSRIEALDERLHRLRCKNDCMTGKVWRRDQGERIETYCGHTPLGPRQDCRCHSLSRKNRVELDHLELTEEQYLMLRSSPRSIPEAI